VIKPLWWASGIQPGSGHHSLFGFSGVGLLVFLLFGWVFLNTDQEPKCDREEFHTQRGPLDLKKILVII